MTDKNTTPEPSDNDPGLRPIGECIDEIDREIKVRQRCYDRWISEGKITRTDATDRLERMQGALAYLDRVKQLREAQADL